MARPVEFTLLDKNGALITYHKMTDSDAEWKDRAGNMYWLKVIIEDTARRKGVFVVNPDFKTVNKTGKYTFVCDYLANYRYKQAKQKA